MSDKIRSQHLARKAILYVRQSSPYQVIHNLESQKLQYAMEARLHQLGWHEIEVVDEDLGRSAAGLVTRAGFERMVAEVCLGKVGAVAAREVSRFARNSREWQQLVEVCRVVDTVLIDQEMVYAPRLSNDRLLLGLKGSLNEYELDLLRQRSVEARREKARRGELIQTTPVGYIKTEDQRLEKDPDLRVQQAILLVFRKFVELGTVRQTLMWFLEHDLQVPTRNARGETYWKRPVYRSMHRMLTSPIYGGTYTYGKTEQLVRYDSGKPRHLCRRKPRERWLALIPGAHEGYVSWEEFERITVAIRENNPGQHQPGAVKNGQALLTGLLRCSRCGRKLTVRYTGSGHDVLRYSCVRGWLDNGEPRCIAFGGISVDEAISKEVLRVVQPAAIEASVLAGEELDRQRDDILDALQRDLEAARYGAERAQRQFDASDPENRLVTAELERRWNLALQHVREIELRIEQHGAAPSATPSLEEFHKLSQQLETIWTDPATSVGLKKRIVRTLIEEVLVDVDSSAGELILILHWKGGAHTELRLPRRRRGQCSTQTARELIDAIGVLARICSDDLIAGILNRNGHLTGRGNRWTRERVAALRSHHRIPSYQRDEQPRAWMNLTDAAALLDVSPRTLRLAIDRGEVAADHPLADGPWIISRDVLESESARALKRRVSRATRRPTIPDSEERPSLFSTT